MYDLPVRGGIIQFKKVAKSEILYRMHLYTAATVRGLYFRDSPVGLALDHPAWILLVQFRNAVETGHLIRSQ